jgi:hypothetical protein
MLPFTDYSAETDELKLLNAAGRCVRAFLYCVRLCIAPSALKEMPMRTITTTSLLLLAVCAAPADASSYFVNTEWNTKLNLGSAPSPTPDQLRAIGDSDYVPAPPPPDVPATVSETPSFTPAIVTSAAIVPSRVPVKEEKRVTAELNRAQLVRAHAISAEAATAKAAKPVAAVKTKAKPPAIKASGKSTKAASAKSAPPTKAASSPNRSKSRV